MLEPTGTSGWGEEGAGLVWGLPPKQLHPIPEHLQGPDGIRKMEMVPRTVSGAGQLRPCGFLGEMGPRDPAGPKQGRACTGAQLPHTLALGSSLQASAASEAQSLPQTLPEPHRTPK